MEEQRLNLNPRDAAALEDFVRRVRASLGSKVLSLKLFGSKATGHDSPESDIDVFVVVHEATAEIENEVLDVAFEVNLAHDVYISPRVVDQSLLEHSVWRITPFLQRVEREGIPL